MLPPWLANRRLVALAGAAVLIVAGLVSGEVAMPPAEGRDSELYRAIIERVRQGESYYAATADAQHSRGYPTQPAFTFRLPTLAVFQAALPGPRAGTLILTGIGLLTVVLWSLTVGRPSLVIVTVLTQLTLLLSWLEPRLNTFHELWAGQLMALSLAAWASGRRRLSLAAGAGALSIREHVLLYVALMGLLALRERRLREALLWAGVAMAFAVGLALHHLAVPAVVPPDPEVSRWVGLGGWGQVLASARCNLVLFQWPAWAIAVAVPVLWAGLWVLRVPDGGRLPLTVTLYFLVFATLARPDNWYWGMLVAPLLPLGVVGLLQAIGDRRAPGDRTFFRKGHR